MIVLWLTAASAADLTPWLGEWGLDPAQSDDPYERLQQAIQAPLLTGGGASRYSPDGGSDDRDEQQRRLVDSTTALLALSGRIGITADPEADLALTFGGEDPVSLTLGKRWSKVKREDGVVRIRARADSLLVVERRVKNAVLTETFLVPEDPDELYVVVRIDGSGIEGLEFRRVYRSLAERPET